MYIYVWFDKKVCSMLIFFFQWSVSAVVCVRRGLCPPWFVSAVVCVLTDHIYCVLTDQRVLHQRQLQHLQHRFHIMKFNPFNELWVYLFHIFFIVPTHNDLFDTRPLGSKHFFLNSTNR